MQESKPPGVWGEGGGVWEGIKFILIKFPQES